MHIDEMISLFVSTYTRLFFLVAPFFGVSMFLKMSEGMQKIERTKAALRTSAAILISIFLFFFFGKPLFNLLGITLPAFQIGAGTTLFISSVMMVLGIGKRMNAEVGTEDDFAVVPLALPIIVGPGTIGTLLVWGTEIVDVPTRIITCIALFCSGLTVMIFLLLSQQIGRLLGQKVLSVVTKVTALVLTALAAQIIFTGVKNF